MDAAAISRTLRRMTHEIVEQTSQDGWDRLAIVGVYTRGVELARRLAAALREVENVQPAFGALDVSMHRDDLRRRPRVGSIQATDLPLDLDDRTVILTDDVLFTGRTVRAALDALGDFGRPRRVQLAVLVDRGHRQLPIRPDYVGRVIATDLRQRVRVRFREVDQEPDAVWVDPPE